VYAGDIANRDTRIVTSSALRGVLQMVAGEAVNLVNAGYYAAERNVKVVEQRQKDFSDYKNLLTVRVLTDEGTRSVSGTVFEGKEPRIVSVDRYKIDLSPAAEMLCLVYPDIPGVVSKATTVLANHRVNIADMAVGRTGRGKNAIMFISVDDPLTDSMLAEIKSGIEGLETIKAVRLGG
jgi:D-3-phosphoglycerate dehydrogenase